MDIVESALKVLDSALKHGISLVTLVAIVSAIWHVEPVREWAYRRVLRGIRKESRIERIERKLDTILSAGGAPWDAHYCSGKTSPVATDGRQNSLGKRSEANAHALTTGASTQQPDSSHSKIKEGSTQTMKEYLKKLGRTKFQAFLVTTITNVALIIGYALNYDDIQDKVGAEAPLILAGAQLLAGIVYQWAESSIDKAKVATEVKTDDLKNLDNVRSDSLDS